MDALTLVRQDHRKLRRCWSAASSSVGATRSSAPRPRAAPGRRPPPYRPGGEPLLHDLPGAGPAGRGRPGPLDQALEQHRLIDRLTRELTDADDDTLQAKITVLAVQVRKHLDTEDATLLTAIEDLIDDDTLIELGRRMEQRGRVIEARRDLVTLVRGAPGSRRRLATTLGGLVASAPPRWPSWPADGAPTLIEGHRLAAHPPLTSAPQLRTLHYGPEEWPSGRRQRP